MKDRKSEYKVALFGATLGVLFTAIYDFIKERPILTTLWNSLKWVWKNLFELKITIWQLLLALAIIYTLFKIRPKKKEKQSPDFLNYTTDNFDEIKWKWDWKWNSITRKWHVDNLVPLCTKCETATMLNEDYIDKYSTCPRCDNFMDKLKSSEKIEAIIIDNVHRNLY